MKSQSTSVGVLIVALLLTGCATNSPASSGSSVVLEAPDEDYTNDSLASLNVSETANIVRYPTNEGLANEAELVVTGTIGDWSPGTVVEYDAGGIAMSAVVVRIDNVRAAKGEWVADEPIYLGLTAGDGTEEFAKSLPTSLPVVAYLNRSADIVDTDTDGVVFRNINGGRPEGSQLWVLSHMQGFAVEAGPGQLLWPLTGAAASGTIQDVLPQGKLVG